MKELKIVFTILVIIFVFTGLNSCKQKNQTQQQKIKIGVILPLTGELAPFGKKIEKGIRLAVADFNKSSKLIVELFVEDDKGETNTTVNAFTKLINIDKVTIVIGTLTSGGTLAIAPLAQKNGILLLSPSASNPKLTNSGSFIYRVWTSDNLDGIVAAEYCFKKLKLRKMAISYQNNDYCLGLKTIFEEKFKSFGGEIIETAGYNEGDKDFKALITKLKTSKCDGVYLPGHPMGISLFLKQSKEIGLSARFISNVAVEDKDFLGLAGNASEGLYYTAPAFDIKSENAIVKTFVANYRAKYNEDPDIFGVKGYESIDVLLKAFASGSLTSVEVCKYIDKTKKFATLEGDLIFDSNGDIVTAVSIKQYKNSKSETIETIKPE